MKKKCSIIVFCCLLVMAPVLAQKAGQLPAGDAYETKPAAVRFEPLHIYIDPDSKPLAVYQFELKVISGDVKIVGVEGGAHPAFSNPPYYDSTALMNDRIIIGAFDTGANLPGRETRVATLHLQISGDEFPEYELDLKVAASGDGTSLSADIFYTEGD